MSTTIDIARYTTEGEAQLAKTQLDDAGIPSMIAGNGGNRGFPLGCFPTPPRRSGYRSQEESAEAARAVLDAHEDGASSA